MKSNKIFLMAVLCAAGLFADGFIIFPPEYLTPLTVKYHKVTCDIVDGIATTVIDQEFINNQEYDAVDGQYIFPVPAGVSISEFNVVVDGVEHAATVMSREEARDYFIIAIKNSSQASLLEYTDNSAYALEVGTVAPGESRRVQISYVEVLPKNDGLSRYLYPLNTERYSMQLIDTVSIEVSITNTTPITSVYSPSYPVTIERVDEKNVVVRYASTGSRPDRDFDLYYKLSDDDISFHLFTFKKEEEAGYFLMLITPQFADPDVRKVVPKDIVFTIDRSGSMSGTKIEQARDALRFCINRLQEVDYFNIVAFQSTVSSNNAELLKATQENISSTESFVNSITATGGTNISEALLTTLSRMEEGERPHYCIFLTDGQATAGVTDISEISRLVNEANTFGTRIFSVGFGFDVNTILIDKISIDNGGFPLYCNPDQNIEEVVSDLYKKIESPILTSTELDFEGTVSTYGISPEKLPDLFEGSEFAVFGRYSGSGTEKVTLSGQSNGELQEIEYLAEFPAESDAHPFVPRLWATQKVATLMTKIKLQALTQEDIEPLIDSIKVLSLEYGIVTPYTSSVVLHGDAGDMTKGLQEASGGAANDASNFVQGMQQNSNSAQTVIADTNAVSYLVAPQVNQMQNAGNKIFVYTSDSVWQDAAYDSTGACDTVYYGSDDYFELAQDAEMRELLSVGNQVLINYKGQNYLILDIGTSRISIPGSKVPAAGKRGACAVRQRGSVVIFIRPDAGERGTVDIYAVDGKRMARLTFEQSEITAKWTASGNNAVAAGMYLAVFHTHGVTASGRFFVR
ncbi:MAG: VWA domain-containing protein [Chitinispirillaceae bacterium]|nr:VWA domain-containing protein [Chitinispirillaceae bacterium]